MPAFVLKCEGIDGCGKTTLLNQLDLAWRARYRVAKTKEFGSYHDSLTDQTICPDKGCSEILRLVAKSEAYDLDDVERELLWITISRRHNRTVLPRLIELYDIVLVDRSNLGNIAPQALLCPELVPISNWAVGNIERANLVIHIRVPAEVCWERLAQRGEMDVVEKKGPEYFRKLAEEYSRKVSELPNAIEVDGNIGILELTQRVKLLVESHREFPRNSSSQPLLV